MPTKPRRYPKDDNFRRLPDAKATRRLIDAMLDMRDPVERPVPDALPPLAKLSRRIEQEADAGRNVRLRRMRFKVGDHLAESGAAQPIGEVDIEIKKRPTLRPGVEKDEF